MMKIQKFSLLDTPESCSIVFFSKCNLNCSYCYNVKLHQEIEEDTVSLDDVVKYIYSVIKDGPKGIFKTVEYIAFSGGECTLHPRDLEFLCKLTKSIGLKTAIYTNGTNPDLIRDLISEKLVDFINVDYKWQYGSYDYSDFDKIKTTQKICLHNCIDKKLEYFRMNTTLIKSIHNYDYLSRMKYSLIKICDEFQYMKVVPRKGLSNSANFVWTLESFFDDNGKIQTLGDVHGEEVSPLEIKDLCARLNEWK